MLTPIQDMSDAGSEDLWYLHESFSSDGTAVITIVASVKPWCREWRAYWMAFSTLTSPDGHEISSRRRFERCKSIGNKIDEDVARAMFPNVEHQHGVSWRS